MSTKKCRLRSSCFGLYGHKIFYPVIFSFIRSETFLSGHIFVYPVIFLSIRSQIIVSIEKCRLQHTRSLHFYYSSYFCIDNRVNEGKSLSI